MSGALTLQTAGAGLNLLSQSALARVLGARAFGQYSFVFNLVQLIATPTDLGASASVTRFIPEYRVQDRPALLRGLVLVVQLVPVVLATLVAGLTAGVLALTGSTSLAPGLLLAAVATMPLFVLSIVLMNVFRAFGGLVTAFAPVLVLQPALLLAAVLAFPSADVLLFAWLTLGSLVVVVLLQLLLLRHRLRSLAPSPREYSVGHWLEVSLPMLLINLLQLAFQRLDIVAVGLLLGAREAGIYTIANRLAVAAGSLQKAMTTVVAPQMSSLHWSGQTREVERLVLHGLRLVVVPAALVTLLLVVAGRPILGLIDDPYRAGYAALVVYSLGQLASVAAGPVGWLAALIGEQRAMARITAFSALVAVVGYAILIPTIGIAGAAAANSIGVVYRNWASGRLTRQHGFHISLVRAFRGPA